jgi:hypothetical protein
MGATEADGTEAGGIGSAGGDVGLIRQNSTSRRLFENATILPSEEIAIGALAFNLPIDGHGCKLPPLTATVPSGMTAAA